MIANANGYDQVYIGISLIHTSMMKVNKSDDRRLAKNCRVYLKETIAIVVNAFFGLATSVRAWVKRLTDFLRQMKS